MEEAFINILIDKGVMGVMLVWFMFRFEKKLDELKASLERVAEKIL